MGVNTVRLLLAEDEKELSKALVAILKHNNYSVDAVYNGRDALEYIETGLYDGIILDIMMPYVDGLTVLKTIRAKGNTVPVILLTAKSEIDDRVNGLDSGANDYLTKPFATKELLARIRAMTRASTPSADNELVFGNIHLDRSTCTVYSDKARFKLANKEYQMLEMLMSNPRRIIPADRFMDKIWGYESDAELNVVWVYVSYLRKKLTAMGATCAIKASRNLGYSLELIDD